MYQLENLILTLQSTENDYKRWNQFYQKKINEQLKNKKVNTKTRQKNLLQNYFMSNKNIQNIQLLSQIYV